MKAAAVIVNFNGGDDLSRCLDALNAQTVPVEVILVDCLSTDGSRRLAEDPPRGVRGVALPANVGYTGGCNAGLAVAPDADVIGFFNPDCFVAPDFFAVCLEALARRSELGGVAPRLMRPGARTLDSCGEVLTRWMLRVRDRGYGEPAEGRFVEPTFVLAACGAGMVYRRAALTAVAVDGRVFPDEFFAFSEDVDLGWRVNNGGWRVHYEPRALATHRRGATADAGEGRMIFRRPPHLAACILLNRWATLLRNLHAVDFLLRLPVLLARDAVMLALVLVRRPGVLPALWAGRGRLRLAWRQRRALVRRRLSELS